MNPIRLQSKEIAARLEALPLRTRLILFIGGLLVVALVWFQFWLAPLHQSCRQLQVRMAQTQADIARLEQAASIETGKPLSADEQNRKLQASIREEIAALDAELQTLTGGMISPKEMAAFLEDLLRQEHGLRLVRLENFAATPLLPAGKGEGESLRKNTPNLFRHTLRLEFEGNYLRALSYLQRLEKIAKRLLWEKVEIHAGSDVTRIVLTVHTLSLRRGWISA